MEKLVFLGIASNSFENLNTSAFAIEHDKGRWILVDCGPDIPRQLIKCGISFVDVEYIILTHRHLDHCLSLPYFVFGRYIETQVRASKNCDFVASNLTIIAETDVWERLQGLLRFAYPDIHSFGFSIEHLDIKSFLDGVRELTNNISLKTFAMNHTVPAYGFIMWNRAQKKLAYSTDTLPCPEFIDAASEVDLLIHEAMVPASEVTFSNSAKHSTASQAGTVISTVRPRIAFLMHIRPSFWKRRLDLEKEASDAAGMQVRYPDEGLTLALS